VPRAAILSGALGAGHDVVSEVVAHSLQADGWEVDLLDCMKLLGSVGARIGDRVFRRISAMPGLYDALHFAHFRQGTRLVQVMDHQATRRLVPAVKAELERRPVELVIATFATGASVESKLRPQLPPHKNMVLCTDVDCYWWWVWEEIDLFLVTSRAAAGSVRRYVPRARIQLVPPPVRPAFYRAPGQETARRGLGIPAGAPCVLLMGGGWGLGPVDEMARGLGAMGVHVLAVAGHNARLRSRLEASASPYVHPFGFTDRIPELMAACDLVVTTPGATTCSEARVVGRHLVILDVFPGHGRQNLQHELELGDADTSGPSVHELLAVVEAALGDVTRPLPSVVRPEAEWPDAFAQALASLGLARSARPAAGVPRPSASGVQG
jgi:processive 1,2-diacylglycerol beta-glucosyltransferase